MVKKNAFEKLKGYNDSIIYYMQGNDVRNLEISALSAINEIRKRDLTFNDYKNLYLTIKYNKKYNYTISVSTKPCNRNFGCDAIIVEFSETELLKNVYEKQETEDKVFVDILLVWDSGTIKDYYQYIDTTNWAITNKIIEIIELIIGVFGKFIGFILIVFLYKLFIYGFYLEFGNRIFQFPDINRSQQKLLKCQNENYP